MNIRELDHMATQRFLVLGDNHGNTESLKRVVDETEGERFDYVVHVGDFTNAHNDGEAAGVQQLQAVEPYLETLEERAEHGLLYVYGNRDYYGDLDYNLDPGQYIPRDGFVTVGGQRFTQDSDAVESDDILVTHWEESAMIDHFEGRAYFCGHTHTGRYKDRMLNSAFLYRDDSHADTAMYGGYFVVQVTDEPPFDVDMRNFGSISSEVCEEHQERGVLIGPDYHNCQYCWRPVLLYREIASSAFYQITREKERAYATEAEIIKYGQGLWESPPDGFDTEFKEYILSEHVDPLGPLMYDEDGRLVDAYAEENH